MFPCSRSLALWYSSVVSYCDLCRVTLLFISHHGRRLRVTSSDVRAAVCFPNRLPKTNAPLADCRLQGCHSDGQRTTICRGCSEGAARLLCAGQHSTRGAHQESRRGETGLGLHQRAAVFKGLHRTRNLQD